MFNCQGLIYLISINLDISTNDHINFFTDEDSMYVGIGISCVFALFAVIFWWIFAFQILVQYHYKQKDVKWIKQIKLLAKIGTILWFCSMITWIGTILFIDIESWLWKLVLALVPEWNRSLVIGWIYSMFYELNPIISRNTRVT
eukprot:339910_1